MQEIDENLLSYKAIYLNLSLQERVQGFDELVKHWYSCFNLNLYLWNLTCNCNFIKIQTSSSSNKQPLETPFSQTSSSTLEETFSISSQRASIEPDEKDLLKPQTVEKTKSNFYQQTIAILTKISNSQQPGIYILENIDTLLTKEQISIWERESIKSHLIKIVEHIRSQNWMYLVILGTEDTPSWTLNSIIPQNNLPPANLASIEDLLKQKLLSKFNLTSGQVKNAITQSLNLLIGLSKEEIAWAIELFFNNVETEHNLETCLTSLLKYKQKRLRACGLEFLPTPNISDVGGMDLLKEDIQRLKLDFSPLARQHNLPLPKGWLLAGPPGSGKSLAAKICALKLKIPLINVGINTVKSGSTNQLKKLLNTIEATAPNICYFDEFDKLFVIEQKRDNKTQEILGILLTWLQEKQSSSFVIATLNRLDALPSELTRAGRFDRIYYVGFPQPIERQEIFRLHLKRFDSRFSAGYDLSKEHWQMLLNETEKFTGAEISNIVETAARQKFYQCEKQNLTKYSITLEYDDLIEARRNITSLFSRDPEPILAMENRAKHIAHPVSSIDTSNLIESYDSFWD